MIHQLQELDLMAKKSDVHGSPGVLFKKIIKENIEKLPIDSQLVLGGFVPFFATTALCNPPPKKKNKKHPALGTSKKSPKKRNFGTATCTQLSVKKLKAISCSQIFRCSEVVFPEEFFGGILGSQPLLPGFSLSEIPLDFHLGGFTPGGGV